MADPGKKVKGCTKIGEFKQNSQLSDFVLDYQWIHDRFVTDFNEFSLNLHLTEKFKR